MTPERLAELRAKYEPELTITNPFGSESTDGIRRSCEASEAIMELVEAVEAAHADGAAAAAVVAERARIVSYLRSFRRPKTVDEVSTEGRWFTLDDAGDGLAWSYGRGFADAIESGEHVEVKP